jgi:hypothetical protein
MAGCCHHDHRETARADGTYRRVLWAALAINAVMFGVEGTAGILSGSVALMGIALEAGAMERRRSRQVLSSTIGICRQARSSGLRRHAANPQPLASQN